MINKFEPTMKYYVPTPKNELDARIAQEQKYLEKALKRIAVIESYPIEKQHKNELKVQKDAVEFEIREISLLKDDHFAKQHAIRKEFDEYLKGVN